jgi:SulP family sulfate permease
METFKFNPRIVRDLRKYSKEKFAADTMAGLIVGIVALPLAIAFAIAASPGGDANHTIGPVAGIITAIVAGFHISAFGGSRVQIGGPTGAFIVIIYGVVAQFGLTGLMLATIMAGIFLVLLGVFRLGTIIKFIPYPIVVGFTSGIALTIFTTQIKDLFALQIEQVPAEFVEKWIAYGKHFLTLDLPTTIVGILSIIIIAVTPKFSKKLPGSLVAIIVATLAVYGLNAAGLTHIETIGDRFGEIKAALPEITALNIISEGITWDMINGLIPTAITIAVLGAIESLLSATVADGVTGHHHDSNQELVGQGIANIVTPFFGGIPATGAIARTMTNINNGGRTCISGIIHALVLLVIFIVLMPLASYIPMSCLAGVLVVVAYNMSGWRTFRELMSNPKSDVSVLLITFVLTVIFDLTVAIEVGLIIACLLFMKRMTESTQIKVLTDEIDANDESDMLLEEHLTIPEGVEVYEINGPYYFGIANKFEEMMADMNDTPYVRIIRMRRVPFIDSTGIHNLHNLCDMSQREGTDVVLSGVTPAVQQTLERAGFYNYIGKDHICPNINVALERAAELVASKMTEKENSL